MSASQIGLSRRNLSVLASIGVAVGAAPGATDDTTTEVILRYSRSRWVSQAAPDKAAMATPLDVSCPTSSWRMVVGDKMINDQDRDPSAQVIRTASTAPATKGLKALGGDFLDLNAVSCRTPTLCVAVGYGIGAVTSPEALRWNGHRWSSDPLDDPGAAPNSGAARDPVGSILEDVSCPSRHEYLAVGSTTSLSGRSGHFRYITGPYAVRLGATEAVDQKAADAPKPDGPSVLTGNYLTRSDANTYRPHKAKLGVLHRNGRRWTAEGVNAPGYADLTGIACPTGRSCFAAGTTTVGAPNQTLIVRR